MLHVPACLVYHLYIVFPLCQLTALKKTLKLKAEEAAKEKEKQPTVETSAEKLRKILKEEKR